MIWVLMGGVSIALLGAIIAYAVFNASKPQPGTKTPDDGRDHFNVRGYGHVPIGQTTFKPYSTDPPTSGPHWDVPEPKGIYSQEPDEQLVHSLEHAYVVIHINCGETDCPDLYNQARDIYLTYDKKIILNYRPQTKSRIALAAWTRMLTIDASELGKNQDGKEVLTPEVKAKMTAFIDAYRTKNAPENDAP